jgi:hypothetical protein
VAPIVEAFSGFSAPWALCGGWAVDAWVGRVTRKHVDVDIAIFIEDQRPLFEHLAGWQLVAHGPNAQPGVHSQWDGQRLDLPVHIHGRVDFGEPIPQGRDLMSEDGFDLDIQFSQRSDDNWVLQREPLISVPIREAISESQWGVPTLVPELLLFFKAFERRNQDSRDFAALLPELSGEQRRHLRDAISRTRHPWLSELSA